MEIKVISGTSCTSFTEEVKSYIDAGWSKIRKFKHGGKTVIVLTK